MNKLLKLFRILRLLGPGWAGYRVYYALLSKLGYWRRVTPITDWPAIDSHLSNGEISPLRWNAKAYKAWIEQYPSAAEKLRKDADCIVSGTIGWYSRHPNSLPDNWHQNPFSKDIVPADKHWSELGEFQYGDIKHIWEPARFCWALTLLRAYWLTDDERYPEVFWAHFERWFHQSPPNKGIHWKCGQETSIRAMNMCLLMHGLASSPHSTDERRNKIRSLILVSGQRIEANLQYAYSQQNNHGTSEAAALFIIGSLFPALPGAESWRSKGADGLQDQLGKLVYANGGFAQHSYNYHRVMLQAVNFAISVAKHSAHKLPDSVTHHHAAASQSLCRAASVFSGKLPMCGGNDGALLFPLTSSDYLDFRPIVQVSQRLAHRTSGFPAGQWDEEALWFGCKNSTLSLETEKLVITADHYIWRIGQLELYLRLSNNYEHRPAHADQLHVDLFWQGQPVLVDSGSYSYNDGNWNDWFSGTAAHNTMQIDGRDQMPRLSRFLFDHWNGAQCIQADNRGGEFEFTDYQGVRHVRRLRIDCGSVAIEDSVDGRYQSAELHWHVHPEMNIEQHNNQLSLGELSIESSEAATIIQSWQSDYYAEKIERSCMSVNLAHAGVVTTHIRFPKQHHHSH
ncbi:MAG: alginate lyase family protein [Pseudomonadota bacterium]